MFVPIVLVLLLIVCYFRSVIKLMNLKRRKFLRSAAAGNKTAVRSLLISERENSRRLVNATDAQGRTALHLAAWQGHLQVVELLIEFKANPNIQDSLGSTPAFRAAWHGHTDSLSCLLDYGASPDLINKIGRSPLHAAAENGHDESLCLLVKAGANVDLPDNDGYSSVHSAAEKGLPKVLEILIQSVASIDLATTDGLLTPLHIAARYGHSEAVSTLLKAGADVLALDKLGRSVLHYAALTGRSELIRCLMTAGCPPELRDSKGFTPAKLACCFGNVTTILELLQDNRELPDATKDQARLVQEVHRLLPKCLGRSHMNSTSSNQSMDSMVHSPIELTDEDLSKKLHEALKKAGFCQRSATAQIRLACKLEEILQHRWNQYMYVVGSFSEAWGNSLRSLNGVTDLDADIDVVHINPDRVLHLHDFCRCKRRDIEYVDYSRGHVECLGVASNPTQAWEGSASRPSTDSIPAIRLCCYPKLTLPKRGKSHIRSDVIAAIKDDKKSLPPHLVAASEPNRKGQQLRLSTSFLERRLIRSLTSEQGHVFVVLKHMVKQVLTKRQVKGLKTYHAKTLMFYLLDKTPAKDWQAKNLVNLVWRALDLLLENLKSDSETNFCMEHFFLPDAKVYLKMNHNSKSEIASTVEAVMKDLPDLIRCFMKRLRNSQTNGGEFSFNPFLILPDPNPSSDGLSISTGTIDSCDIYNAVRSIWDRLSHKHVNEYESLMGDISRLPNCASTVRCCLKALTSLKCGKVEEAKVILSSLQSTSSGFIRHEDLEKADDVSEFVRNKLDTCDWAKKFCFVFADRPELEPLPHFPICIGNKLELLPHFPICILYVNVFFMNFQALYRGLCLQLGVGEESQHRAWFKEILGQDVAHLQEILVILQFCKDRDMLVSLIHKHRKAICGQKEICDKALQLMLPDDVHECPPELMQLSVTRSLEKALARLRQNSGILSEATSSEKHLTDCLLSIQDIHGLDDAICQS